MTNKTLRLALSEIELSTFIFDEKWVQVILRDDIGHRRFRAI